MSPWLAAAAYSREHPVRTWFLFFWKDIMRACFVLRMLSCEADMNTVVSDGGLGELTSLSLLR
jgi:hypothetical protein